MSFNVLGELRSYKLLNLYIEDEQANAILWKPLNELTLGLQLKIIF